MLPELTPLDRELPELQKLGEGEWRARGDLSLNDLEEELEVSLHEDEVHTVGGLIMKLLGRAPETGDEVTLPPLSMKVEEARGRRVHLVTVRVQPAVEVEEEEM